jgi:hypothetical protein
MDVVLDVIIVCRKALDEQNVDQDSAIPTIPLRCRTDKLHERLEELTDVIEQLGGSADYTDERLNAA